ncbi:MAG: GWxTD domain-containing protein [Bryobacterales bacterium]|nr:GWxTD domain-containing protein [Bryobacterales bacterium]
MTYAIGMALLHSLWQGVLVAAALWLALRLAPERRPTLRYILATGGMAALIGWFLWTALAAWFEPAGMAPSGGVAPASALAQWMSRCAWGWIAGVMAVGAWRAVSWAALVQKVRFRTQAPLEAWRDALDKGKRRMGITREVLLRRADWLASPSVYGWLKPVILAPAAAVAGLTAAQLEAILAHELAHVVRRDYLANLLQMAAETLLFYHPAVWWISARMRKEREYACDEMAAAALGDGVVLAAALVRLEEYRAQTLLPAATQGALRARVERLLGRNRQPRAAWMAPACVALAAVCLIAPYVYSQNAEIPAPYRKWLNEDVVYIIENWELRDFKKLPGNEERNAFIEAFWKRRDPTPDTEENEVKKEHYRRISYANQRFPGKDLPGWMTDRGRVYIRLGPPDEIESHPVEGYEEWLYRHAVEGGVTILHFDKGVLRK